MNTNHPAQFVLGPVLPGALSSWQRIAIEGGPELRAHPRLSVTRVANEVRTLVALGYLLDPVNPTRSDTEILGSALASCRTLDELTEHTVILGGRWVLLFHDGRDVFVLHDAAGLRQVVYGQNDAGVWCGSEPYFLASLMGEEIDPAAADFVAATDFTSAPGGQWWPGSRTPFAAIHRLLPNHALRLSDGEPSRYWPNGPLETRTLHRGAEVAASLIRGQTQAAAARYDLTLLLTAGRDSRVCLAAAGRLTGDVDTLTIGPPSDRDVYDTTAMALRFALRHRVVANDGLPTQAFWDDYRANSPLANRGYAANAEAIAPHFARHRVAITGNVAEVVKTHYQRRRSGGRLGADDLVAIAKMGEHPYARDAFAEWLESLAAVDLHGIDPLDLFYWEQRAGSWNSAWLLEYDIVWRDAFVPFNCRAVLTALLGVSERFRRPPFELHRCMIEMMWPSLLSEPFGDDARRGLTVRARAAWENLRSAWQR